MTLSQLIKHTTPDLPFDYQLTRSKRKTVAVYVRSGAVEVRAPLKAPKVWIIDFLHRKSAWVLKQLQLSAQSNWEISAGTTLHYLGNTYTIILISDLIESINIEGDKLIFRTMDFSPASLKQQLINWLTHNAHTYISPRAHALSCALNVAHKLQKMRFRITRSSWGHCSPTGIIQFNPLIMLAPQNVVDYLITHEVCHLLHMNHSTRFWRAVESLCPYYKEAKRTLRALEASVMQLGY